MTDTVTQEDLLEMLRWCADHIEADDPFAKELVCKARAAIAKATVAESEAQADRLKAAYERGYRDGSNGLPPLSDPRFADRGATTPMREALRKIARRTSITFGRGEMSGREAADIAIEALALSTAQVDETERLHELLYESLYHLRLDDGAKAFHEKVMTLLKALPALAPEGDAR